MAIVKEKQVFSLTRDKGLTKEEWSKLYSSLLERFNLSRISLNEILAYNLNLSPEQAFTIDHNTVVKIGKNSRRIFEMRGFGSRLSKAMERKRISQNQLAREISMTQPLISNYLKGKTTPRPISRQRLAFTLQVSYLWLSWNIGKMEIKYNSYPLSQFHLTFAERLTFLMWNSDVVIKDISVDLDVSKTAVMYWMEGSRFPSEYIDKLCKKYNWDLEWLLNGD